MALRDAPEAAIESVGEAYAKWVRNPAGAAIEWFSTHWPAVLLGVAAAIGAYILLHLAIAAMRRAIARLAGEEKFSTGDIVRRVVQATSPVSLMLFSAIVGVRLATENPELERIAATALKVIGVFQLALYGRALLLALVQRHAERTLNRNSSFRSGLSVLTWFINTAVISLAVLLILENVGVDVTALVAGVGVGGIAIGLAAQGIFKDLFSALSILFDKPFEKGDFIIVGSFLGHVEEIGLKTTRLRALSGEQVVIGNSALLDERIQNMGRMHERRVAFTIGLTYQTSAEKLREAKHIVREVIETAADVRFERAHFFRFGDFSLDFEIVFWVTSPDYALYMDRQEEVFLGITQRFAAAKLDFAYPTQTVFSGDQPLSPEARRAPPTVSD
jgi:small-conductance mechanosensitive channel